MSDLSARSRNGSEARPLAWGRAGVACLVAAVSALASPPGASAQAGRAEVREANRLYEQGRYQEAHQKYLEALAEAPESGLVRYNDGNALYKSEDFERAAEAYRRAAESGEERLGSSAWYNLGNALFRRQQFEASLEAYKQALRLRPDDADAKHNLERVLELMQQQERARSGEEQQPEAGQGDEPEERRPQDEPREPEPQEGPRQEQAGEPPPGGRAEPEQRPGQLTREEVERLLDAVREDASEVNRRHASQRARAPRRPW